MQDKLVKPKGSLFLRLVFLLWAGFLSFSLPEVFAGTGNSWLVRPDVYVLGLPLYALHFLLLCHIAVRSKRTSWPALYLFGVIFALYESWITKVIWAGYPGSDGFAMGGFGQWFGVHEILGLTLFYHPVTSFLLPLAVVSGLFPAFGRNFPVPDWVFGKTRWALVRRIGLLFIWAMISAHNMPIPAEYVFSWVTMIAVIILGYIFLRWRGVTSADSDIANPMFGRIAVIITSVWLAIIYLASYAMLLPEKLPPAHIQLITLAIYFALSLIIWRLPAQHDTSTHVMLEKPARMPVIWLLSIFITGIVALLIALIAPAIAFPLVVSPFLVMVPLGVFLFGWLAIWKPLFKRANE